MKTTLQLKLLPTPEQHITLLETMHAFNAACTWIAAYAYQQRCASKFVLQKALYQEIKHRFGLSAQLTIRAIAKTVEAYKRDKNTQVSFRPDGAVVYDQRIMAFKGIDLVSLTVLTGRVLVPIQMGAYQKTQWSRAKRQADLVLVKGQFYLLVTIDTPESPPMVPERFLGIDLGIVTLAADSDGNSYTGAVVEVVRQRCARARQTYQATGTRSAKRRLKKLAKQESRFRRDTNHVISKQLVAHAQDTHAALSLEDLTGIRDRTTVRKSQRNKHSGWSFRQLREFIAYKAQRLGIPLVLVDPRNSSRECSKCGFVEKRNRKSQAQFSCMRCGYTTHADQNAARNLASRGAVMRPDLVAPVHGQLAFAW